MGRYSNCDHGYYVQLPAGIVGHGVKSPAPNDGFAINPSAPRSIDWFNLSESNRFIEMSNFYDLEDHGESASATLDYYLTIGDVGDEEGVRRLSNLAYILGGLSARRVGSRWAQNETVIRRDRILAYRRAGGILYQLTLQSPEKTFTSDEVLFNRIVAGFHLSKLPNDGCSNE